MHTLNAALKCWHYFPILQWGAWKLCCDFNDNPLSQSQPELRAIGEWAMQVQILASFQHMWDSDDLHYWYPNWRTDCYIADTPTDASRRWRICWIWYSGRCWLGAEDMHASTKPKNIQIGPELREIWLKQIVWHVLIIYPLYMSRCECSWTCQILGYW